MADEKAKPTGIAEIAETANTANSMSENPMTANADQAIETAESFSEEPETQEKNTEKDLPDTDMGISTDSGSAMSTSDNNYQDDNPTNSMMLDSTTSPASTVECPSKYVDPENAKQILLSSTDTDGFLRDFEGEFRLRLAQYRELIMKGKLTPEGLFYDFADELVGKTKEEAKAFFDAMMESTGIGKGELPKDTAVDSLSLHPFVKMLVLRMEKRTDIVSRYNALLKDIQDLENEARSKNESIQIQKNTELDQPQTGNIDEDRNSIKTPEPRNATADQVQDTTSPQGRPSPTPDQMPSKISAQTPHGRNERSHERQANTSNNSPDIGVPIPMKHTLEIENAANVPVATGGIGSGRTRGPSRWAAAKAGYGAGLAAGSIKNFMAKMTANKSAGPQHDSNPETNEVDDEQSYNNNLINRLLEGSQRMNALAKETELAAQQNPEIRNALDSLQILAAERGFDDAEKWSKIHAAARGEYNDAEFAKATDNLKKAIEKNPNNIKDTLNSMASLKNDIANNINEIMNNSEKLDKTDLEKINQAMETLKTSNAAFEAPGEERELTVIRKFAEKMADIIRKILERMFNRNSEANDASHASHAAAPAP